MGEDEQEEEVRGQQTPRHFNYTLVSLPGGLLRKPRPERLGDLSEATQPTSGCAEGWVSLKDGGGSGTGCGSGELPFSMTRRLEGPLTHREEP